MSVNYYVGFAYMMLRRYLDAVRTFTNILSLYLRTKSSMSKTYQFDATNKKAEQMFDLLAITISLCTMKIDEAVHNALLERHHDKLMKLQKCDPQDAPAVYEELFVKSCPKFVAPCVSDGKRVCDGAIRCNQYLGYGTSTIRDIPT